MKKYLISVILFVTALLGIVACSSESERNEMPAPLAGESSISFTIDGVKPATRAIQVGTETPTSALDREKSVSELYIALFANGNLYKVLPVKSKTGATYEVKGISAGTYDCYLVANPDTDLVTKLNALTSANTLANFDALIATQNPGENNTATNFLMTSTKKTVNVVADQTTNAGTINLVRLAARFDVYNTIAKLKMTKITFKNRYTQSSLNRGAANLKMDSKLVKNNTKTYGIAEGLSEKQCIAAIYGYENMNVNETVLTLEAAYNGIQVKPFDIVLKNIPVKRNNLYSIVLSPKGSTIDPTNVFGSMNVSIKVVDWNAGTTLSIVGDELINKATPNITVSGAGVTSSPLTNPTTVSLISGSTTSVTVRVESEGAAAVLSPMTGTGYTVTGGDATVENGKLVQTFTIAVEPNTTGSVRNFDFTVANALDASKKRSFTIQHSNRPKMAIEYVAEYNVSATPGVFATSHNNDQSGYYTWEQAKTTALPAGYHLPSQSEWCGIMPDKDQMVTFNRTTDDIFDNSEVITVNGVTNTYTSDYHNDYRVVYALRFKGNGNTMLTAYRYELVSDNVQGNLTSHIKITARYLGNSWGHDLAFVSDPTFWERDRDGDKSIVIPLTGSKYTPNHTEVPSRGEYASLWSSTYYKNNGYHAAEYGGGSLSVFFVMNQERGLAVRPFSDN